MISFRLGAVERKQLLAAAAARGATVSSVIVDVLYEYGALDLEAAPPTADAPVVEDQSTISRRAAYSSDRSMHSTVRSIPCARVMSG